MKALKLVLCGVLLLSAASVASAGGFQKGTNILSLQFVEGTADLVDPNGAGTYLSAYDHSEFGAQLQFWHFMNEEYAVSLSGGMAFFSETDKPGDLAATGATDFKYTQSSWQVRLGGDRVAKISDRFHLFAGPGLQVWNGKAKFDGGSFTPALETPDVMRIALHGRIGVHMAQSERFGGFCQIGHYMGMATAEDKGSKTTWWPSGFTGGFGMAFTF
jgi:hypothetical protein